VVHGQLLHFVAGPDDPLRKAERLSQEYAALEDDYDAAVSQFLQRAYPVAAQFRGRTHFERLQAHAFWKQPGQTKPRDRKKSKWVLFFIMQATTTKERRLASKYAAILDGLMQDQVEDSAVAARIEELGGIDAAYESMRRRDQSSSCQIGESVMPATKRARRRRPKRTFPLYPLVAPVFETKPSELLAVGEIEGECALEAIPAEDAFDFVQRVAREYAQKHEGDHHKSVTHFLQRAYLAALRIQSEPDQFARLKDHPFWDDWWRGPNDPSTSKWVLYFIMRAKTPEVRMRATKYAVILNEYLQWNWGASRYHRKHRV
jgi:hypothetical protein